MSTSTKGWGRVAVPPLLVFALSIGACTQIAAADPDYVWGEASAASAAAQGYEGYWEYCVCIVWDVSGYSEGEHGASHLSMVLELEACIGDCAGACFLFPDTVGTGDGFDGCDVFYYAELDLGGDPTIPADNPTVKFEPYFDVCEPDIAGTAYVCFYSKIPPKAGSAGGSPIWIKFGPYTVEGVITGMLPSCEGTAAVGRSTWSSIKRLFR